jgi:hypothetical protein
MEKLTLDQLEVENFAMQVSQEELSNLKGGSTATCISVAKTVIRLWNTFFGESSVKPSSSSYLQTDSTTVDIDKGGDSTYFHSHTYKYGF